MPLPFLLLATCVGLNGLSPNLAASENELSTPKGLNCGVNNLSFSNGLYPNPNESSVSLYHLLPAP